MAFFKKFHPSTFPLLPVPCCEYRQIRPTMHLFSSLIHLAFIFLVFSKSVFTESHVHDDSFYPQYVLRATAQNVLINCESRYSVVINGTSPGPPIYMEEGQTTWVRVYNDMTDMNLTVASTSPRPFHCPNLLGPPSTAFGAISTLARRPRQPLKI